MYGSSRGRPHKHRFQCSNVAFKVFSLSLFMCFTTPFSSLAGVWLPYLTVVLGDLDGEELLAADVGREAG